MSSNSREAVTGFILSTDGKGNHSRTVTGEEVLSVTLENSIPVFLLLDLLEACLAETDDGLFGRVEGRLGLVDKVQEVVRFDGGGADFGLCSFVGFVRGGRQKKKGKVGCECVRVGSTK